MLTTVPHARAQLESGGAAALAVLQNGAGGARTAVERYLAEGDGPQQVAARARSLLKVLGETEAGRDPAVLQLAATVIADAVDSVLAAEPVVRIDVMQEIRLSENARGFDFGTPDAPPPPGFQKVAANDERISGAGQRGQRRPDGSLILGDGVFNVDSFETDLPNGRWRVTLLTDDLGPGETPEFPFGQEVETNGEMHRVAGGDTSRWLDRARLGAGGERGAGVGGGMVQFVVTVQNGRLRINFHRPPGVPTFIAGIIIEPAEEPSVVDLGDDLIRRLAEYRQAADDARAQVASAVGETLSNVATAAGPQPLAQALQADQPINQPAALVSEN